MLRIRFVPGLRDAGEADRHTIGPHSDPGWERASRNSSQTRLAFAWSPPRTTKRPADFFTLTSLTKFRTCRAICRLTAFALGSRDTRDCLARGDPLARG